MSLSSCTAGIELALRALSLPAGAPILVPALTFIATASAVRCAGLSPVVADVDPDIWLLTPEIARAAVRTIGARAVVPVTTFGAEQDGEAWSAFARDTGVPVIIDAAAGFGNQRDPGPTCSVFSLHATKPLAAGEGGFVVTRDAALAHAIRRLSNFGINLDRPRDGPIGTAVATGTNAKLSEYHAAVALACLDRWPSIAAERAALYARSVRAAQAACGGRLVHQKAPPDTVRSVCAYEFPRPEDRDRPRRTARRSGIGTRRWYLPTIDRQPAFGHVAHLPTPCADHVGERLLGVPFYPGLGAAAIDEIAAALGGRPSLIDRLPGPHRDPAPCPIPAPDERPLRVRRGARARHARRSAAGAFALDAGGLERLAQHLAYLRASMIPEVAARAAARVGPDNRRAAPRAAGHARMARAPRSAFARRRSAGSRCCSTGRRPKELGKHLTTLAATMAPRAELSGSPRWTCPATRSSTRSPPARPQFGAWLMSAAPSTAEALGCAGLRLPRRRHGARADRHAADDRDPARARGHAGVAGHARAVERRR